MAENCREMVDELSETFDELTVIYNRLIKLIEIDSDPCFVDMVARLGKVRGDISSFRQARGGLLRDVI